MGSIYKPHDRARYYVGDDAVFGDRNGWVDVEFDGVFPEVELEV